MITESPPVDLGAHATPLDLPDTQSKQRWEADPPATDDMIYLIGRPTLNGFLRFVRHNAVSPPDKGTLTDEWQSAHRHIRALEKEEAGAADNPVIRKLGDHMEPMLIEFLRDPIVKNSFNTVPTEVAVVELDRLVVYQKHIDLTFVRQLKERLGRTPSQEQVFRTCLPYDHPHPPVKWCRTHGDTYVFMSPSNDLRCLGPMPLSPQHVTGYPPPGSLVGVAGVGVGFGSNFLNAIYTENRLILNNGSHRAYALRDLGLTHVPCIVQHVPPGRAVLDAVACSDIMKDPAHFLENPRPSMLKDYFDPNLRKVIPSHRRMRQVTIKFEVDESYVPAFS